MFASVGDSSGGESLEKVRGKHDMLVVEALMKTVETVIQNRLTPRGLRGLGVSESASKFRFNFKTPQLDQIRKDMVWWKEDVERPLTLELQWPTPSPAADGRFGDDVPPTQALVEQWYVLYLPSATATSTEAATSIASLRHLYKQITVYLRSLYTLLRALPGYQLYKASISPGTFSSSPATPEPHYTYRLLISDPRRPSHHAATFGAEVRTSNFRFPAIETAFGQLRVSVAYREDCQFQLPRRRASVPLNFHVIDSYVQRPGQDAVVPPSLPAVSSTSTATTASSARTASAGDDAGSTRRSGLAAALASPASGAGAGTGAGAGAGAGAGGVGAAGAAAAVGTPADDRRGSIHDVPIEEAAPSLDSGAAAPRSTSGGGDGGYDGGYGGGSAGGGVGEAGGVGSLPRNIPSRPQAASVPVPVPMAAPSPSPAGASQAPRMEVHYGFSVTPLLPTDMAFLRSANLIACQADNLNPGVFMLLFSNLETANGVRQMFMSSGRQVGFVTSSVSGAGSLGSQQLGSVNYSPPEHLVPEPSSNPFSPPSSFAASPSPFLSSARSRMAVPPFPGGGLPPSPSLGPFADITSTSQTSLSGAASSIRQQQQQTGRAHVPIKRHVGFHPPAPSSVSASTTNASDAAALVASMPSPLSTTATSSAAASFAGGEVKSSPRALLPPRHTPSALSSRSGSEVGGETWQLTPSAAAGGGMFPARRESVPDLRSRPDSADVAASSDALSSGAPTSLTGQGYGGGGGGVGGGGGGGVSAGSAMGPPLPLGAVGATPVIGGVHGMPVRRHSGLAYLSADALTTPPFAATMLPMERRQSLDSKAMMLEPAALSNAHMLSPHMRHDLAGAVPPMSVYQPQLLSASPHTFTEFDLLRLQAHGMYGAGAISQTAQAMLHGNVGVAWPSQASPLTQTVAHPDSAHYRMRGGSVAYDDSFPFHDPMAMQPPVPSSLPMPSSNTTQLASALAHAMESGGMDAASLFQQAKMAQMLIQQQQQQMHEMHLRQLQQQQQLQTLQTIMSESAAAAAAVGATGGASMSGAGVASAAGGVGGGLGVGGVGDGRDGGDGMGMVMATAAPAARGGPQEVGRGVAAVSGSSNPGGEAAAVQGAAQPSSSPVDDMSLGSASHSMSFPVFSHGALTHGPGTVPLVRALNVWQGMAESEASAMRVSDDSSVLPTVDEEPASDDEFPFAMPLKRGATDSSLDMDSSLSDLIRRCREASSSSLVPGGAQDGSASGGAAGPTGGSVGSDTNQWFMSKEDMKVRLDSLREAQAAFVPAPLHPFAASPQRTPQSSQ